MTVACHHNIPTNLAHLKHVLNPQPAPILITAIITITVTIYHQTLSRLRENVKRILLRWRRTERALR